LGTKELAAAAMLALRPNDARVSGAGPRASLSSAENMPGPASTAADC
jgi:hypothetical protein